MDGLALLLVAAGMMVAIGLLAMGFGVDSRDGFDDPARPIGS